MLDNIQLMSDEELLEIKADTAEEDINAILNKRFTFLIPQFSESTVTASKIQEALKTNDIEKIMLDKNLSESDKDILLSEQISKYLAFRLGTPLDKIHASKNIKETKEIVGIAMDKYLDEYTTILGMFEAPRRDIPLLRRIYMTSAMIMIYLIVFYWFTDWFMGNTIIYLIGTFLNVITTMNVLNIALLIWRVLLYEKSS